jgi:hypothetical protein
MKKKLIKRVAKEELNKGKILYHSKLYSEAFHQFERSHIIGQRFPIEHTISHYWMLKIALKKRNVKDALGQIFRMLSGFIGSVLNIYPVGNTGGSDVSPFKEMDIPQDLVELLND